MKELSVDRSKISLLIIDISGRTDNTLHNNAIIYMKTWEGNLHMDEYHLGECSKSRLPYVLRRLA